MTIPRVLRCGVLACAALAATRPAWADYSNTVMGLGPVAYYRLNETAPVPAADVATNSGTGGQIGTGYYVNAPFHEQSGALAGNSDTAVAFDGLGQRMQVPFDAAVNPLGPFTVEAWVNPAVAPPPTAQSSLAAVLSYGHLADPRSGWLIYQAAGGWNLRMYNHIGLGTSLTITGGEAPVAGTWYHLVAVYDGTNGYVYANGVLGAQAAATGYYPNTDAAFSVGTRSDVAFHYNGLVDEVALYTNALTAAEILAHYQNGTNAARPTPYDTLVKSSNPLLYFRLNEPTWSPPGTLPMATNSGSIGASADAAYNPGTASGVPGVPFSGLGSNNYACRFNGVVGYLDAGTPPEFDITGPMTILTWIKVNPFNRTWQAIVTKGDSAWRLHRNGDSDNLGFGTSGLSSVDLAGTRKVNDGQWHFVAAVYDATNKYLYVDSQLDASVAATGTIANNIYRVLIGENDQATGRFFRGLMDEVAIFTNALTAAEIQQVFHSANSPPIITQQPQAPAGQILAGAPVSVPVVAAGTPALSYQWTKNGTNAPGQTTATLTFGNITTNDTGNYAVVVTNTYGAVTSSIVALTVT